jgi:hypothetical protein
MYNGGREKVTFEILTGKSGKNGYCVIPEMLIIGDL